MPPPDDRACLWDMRDYAERAARLVEGVNYDDYRANQALCLAVERAIEIIGEAARRLSLDTRQKHPEIPWREIIAQRNVLAHRYDVIDPELTWLVASGELPTLVRSLDALLAEYDAAEDVEAERTD